jgi:hypothetical protein
MSFDLNKRIIGVLSHCFFFVFSASTYGVLQSYEYMDLRSFYFGCYDYERF